MRKVFFLLCLCVSATMHAANVRIIESQSFNTGHQMDLVWQSVVTGMGHVATISPQTTLDNTAFFGTTDVLIVSSGVIGLTAGRISVIQQFVQAGKPVYIQSEYLCNYTSNTAYSSIVNALGGTLTWGNTTAGTLAPMTVNGSMATTPNAVSPLSYYWYGCYGTPSGTVQSFLTYGGLQYGFMFCPPSTSIGRMATTTDQDWVNQSTSLPLMRNILSHLLTAISCTPPLDGIELDLTAIPTPQGKIALNWSTERVNQEGFPALFEVWRSIDGGVDFEPFFQTTDPKTASCLDEPKVIGKPIHYRLRVVDGTGTEFFSKTVEATVEAIPDLLEVVLLGPSTPGNLHVRIFSGSESPAQLKLYDLQSRLIWQSHPLSLSAGSQDLAFAIPEIRPGTYLVGLQTPQVSRSLKFMQF